MKYQSIMGRFMDKVEKTENCWIWKGAHGKDYGKMTVEKRHKDSHRMAYELFKGPIPEGMWVLHTCDNRLCVNPNHLWLGTQKDNLHDMYSKRRAAKGISQWNKYSNKLIVEMRSSGLTARQLSEKYGIDQNYAKRVLNGTDRRFAARFPDAL